MPPRTPRAAAAALLLTLGACAGEEPADETAGAGSSPPASSPAAPVPTASSSTPTAAQSATIRPDPAPADQRRLDAGLVAAAWDNDVSRARRLIAQGADVDAEDGTGQNAYLIATSEGHPALLELVLRAGAEVLARDRYDGTGVIRAAERGHWRIVGRLVQEGVPVDHVNNLGWTALHEAIVLGDGSARYQDTVRVLVASGADVLIRSRRDGTPPVQQARTRGYDAIAATVAAAERAEMAASPRRPGRRLLAAASRGDAEAVALLLRGGAPVRVRDARGRTALDLAEQGGHTDAAQLLAAMGARRT